MEFIVYVYRNHTLDFLVVAAHAASHVQILADPLFGFLRLTRVTIFIS